MSIFSGLMWGGAGNANDFYIYAVDLIQDFGWSLLPQFPGSVIPSQSTGGYYPPTPAGPASPPPVPVANIPNEWVIEGSPAGVYPVLNGSAGPGQTPVPTTTVVVGDVSTEVEHYEEGDFPAGSIFAPGQTWGSSAHDFDAPINQEEGPLVAWGDILDWGLDTLLGQQDWQLGIRPDPNINTTMGFVPSSPIPSGQPALPPSAAPYIGAKMTNGGDCGNRRYVTLDRETGKISCKRRRRRRLLTNRDLADLASLKTITGGGAALNAAVIRAVR